MATSLSAQAPDGVINGPEWNFGFLPQKAEVNHSFILHNKGDAPLTVTKIKIGCSCTKIGEIDNPIDPGDSVAIDITFKSGRYKHRIKKTTIIYTDDPNTAPWDLVIRAEVVKRDESMGAVEVSPRRLAHDKNTLSASHAPDTLIFTNRGDEDLKLILVEPEGSIYSSIDLPPTLKPGESGPVVVAWIKERTGDAYQGAVITFAAVGKDTTRVSVPVEID